MDRQHRAHRGAAGDTEDVGLRERIPQQRLEGRTGQRQPAPEDRGQEQPRQAEPQDEILVGALLGVRQTFSPQPTHLVLERIKRDGQIVADSLKAPEKPGRSRGRCFHRISDFEPRL